MARKVTIGISVLIVLTIAGGLWYYLGRDHRTSIEKILSHPGEYQGKTVTIEGEVTDRTGFFVVLKFFKLRDKTGEIMVVTKKSPPEIKSTVSVKGKIDEAFPIGDQKLLIFVEEPIEKKDGDK
ncbi:MAG TPA: hypothetical protein VMV04_23690 [Thermodesulfobacteriota bacterium]|nr:hypothetical protein [Thermodesulfobacteriota bacterium]